MKTGTDISGYKYSTQRLNNSHGFLMPKLLLVLSRKDIGSLPKRLFELGCGNGAVANLLAGSGWETIGVDPSEEGIELANSAYPDIRLQIGSAYDDLASKYGSFPVVLSLEVVEHVYFPRKYASTKQASMIAVDVLSYLATAVVSFWIVYGTTEFSAPVVFIATSAIVFAIPVHWAFGMYASIVRYIGLSLVAVGLQSTFIVTAVVMSIGASIGVLSAPIRVGIVFWAFALILVVGGRLSARMFLSRRFASRPCLMSKTSFLERRESMTSRMSM